MAYNSDPYEDQFQKKIKAKKESVAKNELHRLRNIARSQKSKGMDSFSTWLYTSAGYIET